MSSFFKYLLENVESLVDCIGTLAKFSLGLGTIILMAYFYKIGYIPTDVNLGDGLIYIVLSFKLFIVTLFFTLMNLFFGYHILLAYKVLFRINNRYEFIKEKINNFKNQKDRSLKILFYILSLIIFGLIGFRFYIFPDEAYLFMVLKPIVCLSIAIFSIVDFNKTLKGKNFNTASRKKLKNKKMLQRILLLCSFPFFYGVFSPNSSVFLDLSTTAVRSDVGAITYIKKSSINLLNANLVTIAKPIQSDNKDEFLKVEGITILLRGLGKNAFVKYENAQQIETVEIPNDALNVKNIKMKTKE